jgi:C4-dicarboxylate-specific signal transduction histidine kinase
MDVLDTELVAERARREVAERRDKTLRDQIAKEAQSQQELSRERDHALQEVVDLKSRLAAMTAYLAKQESHASELSKRLREEEEHQRQLIDRCETAERAIETLKPPVLLSNTEKNPETQRTPFPETELLNLIRHAVEAMNSVTDRARVLRIGSVIREPDGVFVSAEDSGTGLNSNDSERIFDSFFTTKPQGTGMGLSICRSIIEGHHGRLWASSGIAHGALFNVLLLAVRAAGW